MPAEATRGLEAWGMEKSGVGGVWKRVEIESGWMADVRQEIRENVEGDEGRSIQH